MCHCREAGAWRLKCLQKEAGTLRKYLDKALYYFSRHNGLVHIPATQHMLCAEAFETQLRDL